MTKVTKKEETAVANMDYGDDFGAGFEGAEEHLAIPFIAILQSNSPQVEEDGIEGAKAGMLFNTVTNELVGGSDGIVFQPVYQDRWFVEWIPRDSGGGFVGQHDPGSPMVLNALKQAKGRRFGKLTSAEGNDLVETFYAYGNILSEDGKEVTGIAVIAFKSTAIKPFRNWLTSMYTMLVGEEGKRKKPPLYANRARIRTKGQKNKKGSFHNFRIEPFANGSWLESLIPPGDELLEKGKLFREAVESGVAKPVFEKQDREEEVEVDDEVL